MNTLKKIGKYSILLSIKESYLFSKNLFGLLAHPFKTLRQIVREKDYSQAALILGLPFYLMIGGIIFIFIGRFLIDAPPQWGFLAKLLLFCFLFSAFCFLLYLIYWLIKIRRLKNAY